MKHTLLVTALLTFSAITWTSDHGSSAMKHPLDIATTQNSDYRPSAMKHALEIITTQNRELVDKLTNDLKETKFELSETKANLRKEQHGWKRSMSDFKRFGYGFAFGALTGGAFTAIAGYLYLKKGDCLGFNLKFTTSAT